MASIGTGWADGAWIFESWITATVTTTGAWSVGSTKGGGAKNLAHFRRMQRQQLLAMIREDDDILTSILIGLMKR